MGKTPEGKSMNVKSQQQPQLTLEDQIAELKKPYYIAKGNLDAVVDGMLAKVISISLQQNKILSSQAKTIDEFKKIVPKQKWPQPLNQS